MKGKGSEGKSHHRQFLCYNPLSNMLFSLITNIISKNKTEAMITRTTEWEQANG